MELKRAVVVVEDIVRHAGARTYSQILVLGMEIKRN